MAKFDAKNYKIILFEHRGLPGVIGMHCSGYWRGFIGVPKSHCMHGWDASQRTVNVPQLVYDNPMFNRNYITNTTCKHCGVADYTVQMCDLLKMPAEVYCDSNPVDGMPKDNFYYFGFASSSIPNSAWHPDNGKYHTAKSVYYDEDWMEKELCKVGYQLLVIQSMWSKFKEINDDI